jgi:hypothetical protein
MLAMVSVIAPEPLALHVAPPVPAQVQVWLVTMPAGTGSLTATLLTATAPVLVTTTVYVTLPPGDSVPVTLDVLDTLMTPVGGLLTETAQELATLPSM